MKTKKIIKCVAFIIIIQFLNKPVNGQFTLCGTEVTQQQIDNEKKIMSLIPPPAYPGFAPVKCLRKKISINAYIVRDSLGNAGVSSSAIDGEIITLNSFFAPMCVEFEVCAYTYIDNYKYDDFLKPIDEDELYTLYHVDNTINMYFASKVQKIQGIYVGGYAYFPGGRDFIIISKGSLSAITHEMGHFFGLYHTFEDSFGLEFANGSNCSTTGDLLCDTPADPNGTAGPDCQLSPYTKDPNGDWYVPQIGNIMSYYGTCVCGFTTDQYNRMVSQFLTIRNYLW